MATPTKPMKSRLKMTVYLDKDPDVVKALDEALETRVFSYLCTEALRDWLKKNNFIRK